MSAEHSEEAAFSLAPAPNHGRHRTFAAQFDGPLRSRQNREMQTSAQESLPSLQEEATDEDLSAAAILTHSVAGDNEVYCAYRSVGCDWHGTQKARLDHEHDCLYRKLTEHCDVMPENLATPPQQEQQCILNELLYMLSLPNMQVYEAMLHRQRTRLRQRHYGILYESAPVFACTYRWRLRARTNEYEANAAGALLVCLILESDVSDCMLVHFHLASRMPEVEFQPRVFQHLFGPINSRNNCRSYNFLLHFKRGEELNKEQLDLRLVLGVAPGD